jgi:biopolymer transport protein ExbD
MTFASFHTPKGFYVELPSARCESDVADRLIVLRITGTGEVFLNLEHQDWNTLASRLSEIYRNRKHRKLYLLADSDVPFQTVAHALDTVVKHRI